MSTLLGLVILGVFASIVTYPIRDFVSERIDMRRYRKTQANAARR